jgi:glycosyltransferase involved in cell wall biosynthesis
VVGLARGQAEGDGSCAPVRRSHGVADQKIMISIVTISLNQAQFLDQALRSVLDQQGVAIEYIVVDAGSIDRSRAIVDSYRARLSRTIFEPDRGPADGLNKGFSYATGDIYCYINSDDYLLPGALKRVEEYFESHPEVDVVSGNAVIVDAAGKVLRMGYSERFSARMEALGAAVLMQPSTFWRARAHRLVGGFNPKNNAAWDGEFFFRLHRLGGRFSLMDEVLSAYRIHASSITGSAKLDDAIRNYRAWTFREMFGRDPRWIDKLLVAGARVIKHLHNLRGVRERLLHGPIYGRVRNPN